MTDGGSRERDFSADDSLSDAEIPEESDGRDQLYGPRERGADLDDVRGVDSRSEKNGPVRQKDVPTPTEAPLQWVFNTDNGFVIFLRDALSSVVTVAVVAALLFAISGIWPPLVAVESGSMEPHMERGDLVFLMDEQRFAPDAGVDETGVVTYRKGQETGYWSFGSHGNVVVFRPDGGDSTPIIHRAHFFVEEGDNWVAAANDEYLRGGDTCADIGTCPAPHDGFITKGDNNPSYDQVGINHRSTVVKPSWVKGRAKARIPFLGYVRLWLGSTGPPAQLTVVSPIAGVSSGIFRFELAIGAFAGLQLARTG